MRFNDTGDPGAATRGSTVDDGQDLPDDVQNDVDRIAEVVAAGFRGPVWQQMAEELYAHVFDRLCAVMRRTDKLMHLTEKSKTPLAMTDEDRATLYRSTSDCGDHAVWNLTVDGLSQGEIADLLGIKVGDVENARYRLRSQIRTRRRSGELHVSPGGQS